MFSAAGLFSGEEKKRPRGTFHAVPLAASDSSENSAAARYRIEIENSARVHGGRDVRLCQWLLIVVVVTVFVCLFSARRLWFRNSF